jgi:predicted dehydrogenase
MPSRRDFLRNTAAASVVAATSSQIIPAAYAGNKTLKKRSGPLRLGIVGTGQISTRYLKPGSSNPRVRFIAACARTLESAKARASEFKIPTAFDDYRKMYDTAKLEAVIIAAPPAVHADAAIAALERGIHVLCEKPMAMNLEQCHAMVAAARKSGAVLLALPYDATPATLTALEHLNEPTLGVFTGAEANVSLPGVARDNWYYDIKVAGGGAGLDTLVYPVSKLITLLGPARRVSGFSNTLITERILGAGDTIDYLPPPRASHKTVKPTVDDNATLLIEWANGQLGVARTLWGTSYLQNSLTVYGRRGTLWTSVFGGDVILHSPDKEIAGAEKLTWNGQAAYKVPLQTPAKAGDEGLIDHFVDCIDGKAQPKCGGEQALHVHEILFKGYEAGRMGRVQDLQTAFTPWHAIDPSFYDTHSRPL